MLHINNHEITGIYRGLREIKEVYDGIYLVWVKPGQNGEGEIILSCYYNGYWIDDYLWTDDTPWTD